MENPSNLTPETEITSILPPTPVEPTQNPSQISRRGFLRLAGVAGAATLLSALGVPGNAVPTAAAVSGESEAPTSLEILGDSKPEVLFIGGRGNREQVFIDEALVELQDMYMYKLGLDISTCAWVDDKLSKYSNPSDPADTLEANADTDALELACRKIVEIVSSGSTDKFIHLIGHGYIDEKSDSWQLILADGDNRHKITLSTERIADAIAEGMNNRTKAGNLERCNLSLLVDSCYSGGTITREADETDKIDPNILNENIFLRLNQYLSADSSEFLDLSVITATSRFALTPANNNLTERFARHLINDPQATMNSLFISAEFNKEFGLAYRRMRPGLNTYTPIIHQISKPVDFDAISADVIQRSGIKMSDSTVESSASLEIGTNGEPFVFVSNNSGLEQEIILEGEVVGICPPNHTAKFSVPKNDDPNDNIISAAFQIGQTSFNLETDKRSAIEIPTSVDIDYQISQATPLTGYGQIAINKSFSDLIPEPSLQNGVIVLGVPLSDVTIISKIDNRDFDLGAREENGIILLNLPRLAYDPTEQVRMIMSLPDGRTIDLGDHLLPNPMISEKNLPPEKPGEYQVQLASTNSSPTSAGIYFKIKGGSSLSVTSTTPAIGDRAVVKLGLINKDGDIIWDRSIDDPPAESGYNAYGTEWLFPMENGGDYDQYDQSKIATQHKFKAPEGVDAVATIVTRDFDNNNNGVKPYTSGSFTVQISDPNANENGDNASVKSIFLPEINK